MYIEANSPQLKTNKYEKETLHFTVPAHGPYHYSTLQHSAGVCYCVVVAMTKCLTRNNFIRKRFVSLVVWGSCSAWENIATGPDPSHGSRCLLTTQQIEKQRQKEH